jgi:hypothetical protein
VTYIADIRRPVRGAVNDKYVTTGAPGVFDVTAARIDVMHRGAD